MWRVRGNMLIQLGFIYLAVLNAHTVCSLSIAAVKNGTLIGMTMRTRLGRDIHAFLGIPYAAPPIGELRFEVRLFCLSPLNVKKYNKSEIIGQKMQTFNFLIIFSLIRIASFLRHKNILKQ